MKFLMVLLFSLFFVGCSVVSNKTDVGKDLDSIHQAITTIDTHIDVPVTLGTSLANSSVLSPMQVDIPKMRDGGLDVGFFIVYVAQGPVSDTGYVQAYSQAQQKFNAIERMVRKNPDNMVLARNPEELKSAVDAGKLVAVVGVENAFPLGNHFEHLQEFYDRGARYISLTHFGHNHFADSSVAKGAQADVEEPINNGLSDIGRDLIASMNRLGIMVDISHTSKESTLEAVEMSQVPVIASHSGVKALFDHPRNLTDEEIKAIAERDGVIQLVAFDSYMRTVTKEEKAEIANIRAAMGFEGSDWYKKATQEQLQEFRTRVANLNDRWVRSTVADFVDQIDYVAKLVGVEHAGIASDFGGGGGIQGWDDISQARAITEELLNRGYSTAEIELVWSGNLLRVWSQVDAYAQRRVSQRAN